MRDILVSVGKHMAIIKEEFRIPDPYEAVVDIFGLDGGSPLLEGSAAEFCARLVFIIAGAFAFLFLLDVFLPSLVQGIAIMGAIVAAVLLTWSFLSSCNKKIADEGLLWVVKHAAVPLALIVVVAGVA